MFLCFAGNWLDTQATGNQSISMQACSQESLLDLEIVPPVDHGFALEKCCQEAVPRFDEFWARDFVILGAWPAFTDTTRGFDLRADGFVHEEPDLHRALEGSNIRPCQPLWMMQPEHMAFVEISDSERGKIVEQPV
jgi:hypothetical protein